MIHRRTHTHTLILALQVDDFVRPTLLVGLFKAPEELSAAVALELLYYYALAHQTSFDVRWIKEPSIAEAIIAPLAAKLAASYDLTVIGSARVEALDVQEGSVTGVTYTQKDGSKVRVLCMCYSTVMLL
jgi:hypothetical protein